MAGPYEAELSALRNLILQSRDLVATADLPEGRGTRACELLNAAVALTDDLLTKSPAAVLGSKGGSTTAERLGSEHFRKLAAMRKTKGGGRPRKAVQ